MPDQQKAADDAAAKARSGLVPRSAESHGAKADSGTTATPSSRV